MKLNEKIKQLRENKKLSQSYIAYELGLDQSQYSRREKGEIQFIPDEIIKLSKMLETTIANLFEEQQNDNDNKQNLSILEKLTEQYELRLKEKDEMIALLRNKK